MKTQIAENFVTNLQSKGVCTNVGTATCNVQDVSFDCGAIITDEFDFGDFRKKRSVQQALAELKVKFKIGVPEISKRRVNCSLYCANEVLNQQCLDYCGMQHKDASEQVLNHAAAKVEEMFNSVDVPPSPLAPPDMSTQRPRTSQGTTSPSHTLPDRYVYHEVPTRFIYHDVSSRINYQEQSVQQPGVVQDHGLTLRIGGLILVPMPGLRLKSPTTECGPGVVKHTGSATECGRFTQE